MKTLLLILLLAAPQFLHAQCGGTWRWDVKTCSDEPQLLQQSPTETTVETQSHLHPPQKMALHTPRTAQERSVLQVTAYVVGWKIEADSDIHLQLRDLSTNDSMVAEIPNPNCTGIADNPIFVKHCEANREWVFDNLIKKNAWKFLLPVPVKITLTGLGFFDEAGHYSKALKTTVGHANGSNIFGREIHPVTGIELAE